MCQRRILRSGILHSGFSLVRMWEAVRTLASAVPNRRMAFARTSTVSRYAFGQRRSAGVFLSVTSLYLLRFLYLVGDLSVRGGLGVSILVVETPLTHALRGRPEPFMYEPIARLDLWVVRYLFSLLSLLFSLAVSILVGLNLALSLLAISQPRSCRMEPVSVILSSVPALLAGSTCCAQSYFYYLGSRLSCCSPAYSHGCYPSV
jgi:hypothetical protein